MVSGIFQADSVGVVNKPAGLDFVNHAQITEYVQVSVRAPQSSWGDLKAASFQATVDLSGLTEGPHEVPIEIGCSDSTVRLDGSQPSRVSVRLERIQERVFEVKVRIMDDPALGYEVRTATGASTAEVIRRPRWPGWTVVADVLSVGPRPWYGTGHYRARCSG
jgi:hypothetical protein